MTPTSHELYLQLKAQWEIFEEEHNRYAKNEFKTAAIRARKALNEIKRLAPAYRRQTLNEGNQLK